MPPRPHRSRHAVAASLVRGLLGTALVSGVAAQTQLPQESDPTGAAAEASGGLFSGGLLPNGSILKNVVLPSYDEKFNLASAINAGELTIFTREVSRIDAKTGKAKSDSVLDKIKASNLKVRFFHPDRSPQGSITMSQALFEARPNFDLLTTQEPVSFVSDDLKVDGSGLAFDTKDNRGFLHGPVTAVAKTTDLRTSMNVSPARRASFAAGALLMAAVPTLPAQDQDTPPVPAASRLAEARPTPDELAQVARDKATAAPQVTASTDAASQDLEKFKAGAEDARITMNSFLQGAALTGQLAQPAAGTPPDVPRPPQLAADPEETLVKSKDGAYFDAQQGLVIFLGDVTVKNPQLELKGASEVKLFMEPQKKETAEAEKPAGNADPAGPPKAPPTPEQLEKMKAAKAAKAAEALKEVAKAEKGEAGGNFGDVKRMVATGPAVHIKYHSGKPGDKPIEAMAHTVVYNFEKHQILLEGGSPWAIQEGGMTARANGPDAYILVHTDEDGGLTKLVTFNPGGFEANIKTPEKDKKDKKPKDDQPKNR